MFIIVPANHFVKKARKWIIVKDFLIADASGDPECDIMEMGNRVDCGELVPTPKLSKMALDPTSHESKIMRNNERRYLENWLTDDGVLMRITYFGDVLVRNFEHTGEDINIFLAMRKEYYREFGEAMADMIREQFGGADVVRFLTKKMDKDTQEKILTERFPAEVYQDMKKCIKRNKKNFNEERLREMYKSV